MRRIALFVAPLLLLVACGGPCEEPEPTGYWGDAVNGLTLGVEPAQTSFSVDDEMAFTVRAKNEGTSPLVLAHFEDHMWWYRLTFESLDGGPDFDAANEELLDFSESPDHTLPAGETWTKELPLTQEGRFLRVIPDRKPGDDWDYRDRLPPGRYRVMLQYRWTRAEPKGYWTGTVRSNVLELEITPAS